MDGVDVVDLYAVHTLYSVADANLILVCLFGCLCRISRHLLWMVLMLSMSEPGTVGCCRIYICTYCGGRRCSAWFDLLWT